MPTRLEIKELALAHPSWCAKTLAMALGCSDEQVRSAADRYGFKVAKARGIGNDPKNLRRKAAELIRRAEFFENIDGRVAVQIMQIQRDRKRKGLK